jgi:hypothetical protein
MLEFIETASAIRALYNHVKESLTEEDFWPLTAEQYARMPLEEQSRSWFMINPARLKEAKAEIWVADEEEKDSILRAIRFIEKTTSDLPAGSSFLEKLLYAKKTLPSVLFKSDDEERMTPCGTSR